MRSFCQTTDKSKRMIDLTLKLANQKHAIFKTIHLMKLNSKIHGTIDYLVVVFLWISPSLFGLPEATSIFTYVLGTIHLALTFLTDFELGVVKLVPLKIHGIIELAVSIVLIAVAIYFDSTDGTLARNFYLGFGAAVFVTWAFSDYQLQSSD